VRGAECKPHRILRRLAFAASRAREAAFGGAAERTIFVFFVKANVLRVLCG
jgi:hypothetical protein